MSGKYEPIPQDDPEFSGSYQSSLNPNSPPPPPSPIPIPQQPAPIGYPTSSSYQNVDLNAPPQPAVYVVGAPAPGVVYQQQPIEYTLYGVPQPYVNITGAPSSTDILASLISREYEMDLGLWLSRAWNLYKANWLPFVLLFLVWILAQLCSMIPFVGFLFSLLSWPIIYGFFIGSASAARTGDKVLIPQCFGGFYYFGPLFIISLLQGVLVSIGFLLCIIPGIYLLVALSFAPYIFLEYHSRGVGIIDSFTVSAKTVNKKFFWILLYLFLIGLFMLSGILLLGVGLFVTVPVGFITFTYAFDDMFGLNAAKIPPSSCVCC